MKSIYTYITFFFLLLALHSCKEEEVAVFSAQRGINFLAMTGTGTFEDDYTSLKTEINFFEAYVKNGFEGGAVPIQLCAQLEGTLSDTPINVRLKLLEDDGYDLASISLPSDSVMEPGKYQRTITVQCNKPEEYDKEYHAIVTFDYDAGGLVPGTKERQKYTIVVKDAADWAWMNVSNEDEWNKSFSEILGQYGPVKVRFILAALGKTGKSYTQIGYLYYYTLYYPNYGFKTVMADLKAALAEYNSTHDTPLTEPDGRAVSFPSN